MVQWLRLPESERHAGDDLDATLVERLEKVRTKQNEDYLIAAPLAARLGLEHVVAADDHTDDESTQAEDDALGAAMQDIWKNPAGDRRRESDAAVEAGYGSDAGVLAMYRYYNDPVQARYAFDSDFGAALLDTSPERYGRRYTGYWEVRNLRMVSRVRAAMVAAPGTRTLAVVGVSHKGYFDAYLRLMHDVRVQDSGRVLGAAAKPGAARAAAAPGAR